MKRKYGAGFKPYNTSRVNKTILKSNKGEIIIGSYAFNKQVKYPFPFKKTPHTDIDIKHKRPRKAAKRIERNLDRYAGCDNYYVEPLKHDQGITYRVKDRAQGGKTIADVSKLKRNIPTTTIDGEKYETLSHREKEINKMLKDPKAAYRREKDLRMKAYINRYKKSLQRRRYI